MIPQHLERHLVVNIPLHPMPVPTDGSPTGNPISGSISTIQSFAASSPSAPSVPEISTSQHAALGARPINPLDRYGEWHYYSFTAIASTLPSVLKTYDEAINFVHAKEWKAGYGCRV